MKFRDIRALSSLFFHWSDLPDVLRRTGGQWINNFYSQRQLYILKAIYDKEVNPYEVCKVTKIQHVKFKGSHLWNRGIEALFVETDVGLNGLPVNGSSATKTGNGGRFVMIRAVGADTKVLEDLVGYGYDQKTREIAKWIKDEICDGPQPTAALEDYLVCLRGDMDVYYCSDGKTSRAQDSFIDITWANISTFHYEVLRELEVPPGLPDTALTVQNIFLIASCAARLDAVYSVFMRQDSWFARLIFGAVEDMFHQSVTSASSKGVDVSEEGGIEREGRTDFIRVGKREDFHPASGIGLDGSMWKRVFISTIEERLVRDVLEEFRVGLEQELSWKQKALKRGQSVATISADNLEI